MTMGPRASHLIKRPVPTRQEPAVADFIPHTQSDRKLLYPELALVGKDCVTLQL